MEPSKLLNRLQHELVVRATPLENRRIDEKKRTVNVAFASDRGVDHFFGKLILTMNSKSMRSERLKSGAALLMDHDWTDQIGVVENFSIAGGVARADVRFSRSARAEEVFQDVIDGIRQNISVGFMIHELHLESDTGDVPVYRSDDWEPYEISVCAVPADVSVGVGRSSETKGEKYVSKFENTPADTIAARQKELVDWAGIFGEEKLAQRMLLSNPDLTREQLRVAIAAKRDAEPDQVRLPVEDPAGYAARSGYYEPAHSLPRYGKLEGFRGREAEARAFRFGQWLLAAPFGNRGAAEWCQRNGLMLNRAGQYEGQNEKGGFLVPTEFGNDIVDLIEEYGVFRQHAKVVPMMSDRRVDPVIDGELESQFVGELEEGTDQDLEFGMIGLTALKHMILIPLSSEVAEDAAISIADTVAVAAARAFAKKEDSCGFNGDGTATYGGIVGLRAKLQGLDADPANIPGLVVAANNNYSDLWLSDLVATVGRLPEYADSGNAKWFVSRRFYYDVMVASLLNENATATEIEDARNRRFLGYDVVFTQVMPRVEANSQVCAIFGDLSLGARFGDRRRVTIALDDSILFRKDALLLRATSRFDINVHGVGDTTEAGPICGLITAAS